MKYAFGEFELNPATRELWRNGVAVALRPRSLECLVYLIEHRDRAVGRDELVAAVWGKVDAADTVVAQTVLRARKALDDTGSQQGMIRTLPRFGYRWVAPVREVDTALVPAQDLHADDSWHGYGAEVVVPTENDAAAYAASLSVLDTDSPQGDIGYASAVAMASDAMESAQHEAGAAAATVEIGEAAPAKAAATRGKATRRWRLGLLASITLLVLLGVGVLLQRHFARLHPQAVVSDSVLVMPVTVIPDDSESAWVRLGAMDYMATRLHASGINVLPSEQVLRLDAAMHDQAPDSARKQLLALSGARWIALPEMRRQRDGWSVRLRIFDAGSERTLEARGETALLAAAAVADVWLQQLGDPGRVGPRPGPLAERLQRIDAEILSAHLTEARRLLRSSAPAERGDARFLLREGKLESRAGNFDVARRSFQDAAARSPETDIETRVGAMMGLASVERARNDPKAAAQRYTEALALLEPLPPDRANSRMRGIAYQGRGISFAQMGDLDAGIKEMGLARVWLQRSGDQITLGSIGHNLGKAEALRGDYLQALREFDRSIATFERFRVYDYLANSLLEKASVQLVLARPLEARVTIERAEALLPKLEDADLIDEVLQIDARIQIALGKLRDADATLARSQSRGGAQSDPIIRELRLRLLLARNDVGKARQMAREDAAMQATSGGLLLAAVQAALRGQDLALANAWLDAAAVPARQSGEDLASALALAAALVARADATPELALAKAEQAAAVAGSRASPESEIRTGVLRAMLLLDTRQYGAASAIMGELEKYAESDYRVAWVMTRLYQSLGDADAAAAALQIARTLAGERDLAVEPIL